jgi:transcription antitermination factor NusG
MNGDKVLKQKTEGKRGASALVVTKKRRRAPVYVWLNIQPEISGSRFVRETPSVRHYVRRRLSREGTVVDWANVASAKSEFSLW